MGQDVLSTLLSAQEEDEDGTSTTSSTSSNSSDVSKLFASLDTDADGSLSETELDAALDAARPPPPPPGGPRGGSEASASGANGASGSGDVSELFAKLDTDGDGSLSRTDLEDGVDAAAPPPPPGGDPRLAAQEEAAGGSISQDAVQQLARQLMAAIENVLKSNEASAAGSGSTVAATA